MASAIISKPVGTLKYTVGAISRRLRRVSPISAAVGLPSSMYSVPPCIIVRPKLWLLPKVWFHGSQSTSTGEASASTGSDSEICCRLAHHMRWVLMTGLGILVEPLVNRNFTMVPGPVACMAASTAGVAVVWRRLWKVPALRPSSAPWARITSTSAATVAAMALP